MLYIPLPIGRICRICKLWKPYSELKKHKCQPDGVEKICVACNRTQATNYFYSHHNEVLEKRKDEYLREPEKVKARNKRTSDKPESKIKALARANKWSKSNPDKVRQAKRKSNRKHIAKHRDQKRILEGKRRARKFGLPNVFTDTDWKYCLCYWHECCAVCGKPVGLWHTIAADHWIPLSDIKRCPGTTNILPLCHSLKNGEGGCNNSKWNRDPVEWLTFRLGPDKAKAKLAEIEAYFASVAK